MSYCKSESRTFHVTTSSNVVAQALLTAYIRELQRQTMAKVDAAGVAGPAAEYLWTPQLKFEGMGEHCMELCSLLSSAIRGDDSQLMPSATDVVHAINVALCVSGPRSGLAQPAFPPGEPDNPKEYPPGTTFRGGGFDDQFRDFFTKNKKYRVPGLLATSFDRSTAENFRDNIGWRPPGSLGILWVVHVDPDGKHDPAKRCNHVNYVSHSHIVDKRTGKPAASEYLFTAFSVFTVLSAHWGDDKLDDEALPNAPWY